MQVLSVAHPAARVTPCGPVHFDAFDGSVTRCSRCGRVAGSITPAGPDFAASIRHKPAGLQTRTERQEPSLVDGLQRRFTSLEDLTVDAETRTFEGYAVKFGQKNSHKEIFMPGAFKRTLASPPDGEWPSFYFNHDWNTIVGEWLDIREDDVGLFVKGEYLESMWGDHARALARKKLASGLSIGFTYKSRREEHADNWEKYTCYVEDVDLYEISQVQRPSDKAAGITNVRAIRSDMTRREVEDLLRSQGATRAAARAMASQWRPKDEARDAPDQVEAELRDAAAQVEAREAAAATRLLKLLTT